MDKPILTLLTAALDTVGDGYEYDSLFRYLKTGLAGVDRADVDRLENYVLRWEVRGSQWSRKADWSWHPEGYGIKWSAEDRALVRELDQLRRQIIAPLEQLRKTPAATGGQLVRSVYRFLEEIQLPSAFRSGRTSCGPRGICGRRRSTASCGGFSVGPWSSAPTCSPRESWSCGNLQTCSP